MQVPTQIISCVDSIKFKRIIYIIFCVIRLVCDVYMQVRESKRNHIGAVSNKNIYNAVYIKLSYYVLDSQFFTRIFREKKGIILIFKTNDNIMINRFKLNTYLFTLNNRYNVYNVSEHLRFFLKVPFFTYFLNRVKHAREQVNYQTCRTVPKLWKSLFF